MVSVVASGYRRLPTSMAGCSSQSMDLAERESVPSGYHRACNAPTCIFRAIVNADSDLMVNTGRGSMSRVGRFAAASLGSERFPGRSSRCRRGGLR